MTALDPPARTISARDILPSILVAVGLLIPGAVDVAGPYLDAAVFSEVGAALREGGIVYIDSWDHKPPGIFVLDGLSQAVLPFVSPWLAAWVGSVAASVVTLLLIAVVLRTEGAGRRIGLTLCAAAVGLTVYPVAVGGGLAEVPALAFAMGAFVAVQGRGAGLRLIFLAGALSAWACIVNPQAASAALAVFYLALRGRTPSDGARAVGALLLGLVIVSGATLAWLWSVGALPAALDAIVTYNRAYVQINRQNIGFGLVSPIVLSLGCLACLIVPAAFSQVMRRTEAALGARVMAAAWIWLGAFALLTAAQGRIAPHYFLLAVPPLAILGAPTFDEAFRDTEFKRRRLALLVIGAGIVISTVVGSIVTQRYFDRFPNRDQVNTVASWIRANTTADATVFVWGNQPYVYDAADRRPASKYVHMLPLTTPGYSTSAQVADLVIHLESKPPSLIVDAGSLAPGEPGWLPLLVPRSVLPLDGRDLDMLDPLRAFVRQHYYLADVVDGWPVYLRDRTQ